MIVENGVVYLGEAMQGPTQVQRDESLDPLPLDAPASTDPAKVQSKQEIIADINREARKKATQIEQNEKLKESQTASEKKSAELVRVEKLRESIANAHSSRIKFAGELKLLLSRKNSRLADRIRGLVNRYGKSVDPDVMALARKVHDDSRRMTTAQFVDELRDVGFPETLILDVLLDQEVTNIPARGGPRDEDEALVLAARRLIRIPIREPHKRPGPW